MKLGDLKFEVDNDVYPPAEDTYLLLDAIEIKRSDSFLEVGCGAGLISIAAARVAKRVVAVDISLEAVRNAAKNLMANSLNGLSSVIQSDLLGALAPATKFSVIVFNPPYLPADESVTEMDHAFVGGVSGVEIAERFIQQAIPFLEKKGRIYIVVSSLADIERVSKFMQLQGLQVSPIAEASLFFESIRVLKGNA